MKSIFIISFMLMVSLSFAQPAKKGNTVVFKVRAPIAVCTLFPEDSVFWIEKLNKIRVKVKTDKQVKVQFSGGKIIAQDGDNYTVKFDSVGTSVVSVYETDGKNRKLVHTAQYKVKEPELYFCGIKVATRARGLKMKEEHFRAYSVPLDTALRVVGFEMQYYNGKKFLKYHSDTSMLSNEMRKVIFEDYQFPAEGNKQLFFSNIKARMPDGQVRYLSPITLFVERDSTDRDNVVFEFSVRRMKMSR